MAALVMPLVSLLAPPVRISMPVPSFVNFGTPPARDAAQTTAAAPSAVVRDVPGASTSGDAPIVVAYPGKTSSSSYAAPQIAAPHPRQYAWPVVLVAAYFTVALLLLTRLFVGLRLSKRLESSATPIEDSGALRVLAAAACRLGVSTVPKLAECQPLSVPLTLGTSHPIILLPVDWREWESGELEAVLAHEVSHVARRDPLVQRLTLIHRAIFWFSPLAWWLERGLVDLAEQASDEAALVGGADRRRYAEMLLGFFAALEGSPERVWWQGVSMAKAGQAEKRVEPDS